MSTINAVIDCETLGTAEDAIILQIAVSVIDPNWSILDVKNVHSKSWKVDVKCQKAAGRSINNETMLFWQKNSEQFMQLIAPNPPPMSPTFVIHEFAAFLKEQGFDANSFIWQRGSKDLDWITSLAASFGAIKDLTDVVNFWQGRDIRTAIDVLGFSEKCNGYMDLKHLPKEIYAGIIGELHDHDAASDVIRDSMYLRIAGVV